MLAHHRITRYVEPLREGGSLPGLVEADDDGLYVVKLRGAGQGLRVLVAELLVGGLASHLGLRVPELVTLELDPAIGRAEPDPEIQQLLQASAGLNVGLDFLPAALPYAAHAGQTISREEAASVVWLDLLTTNVDRTPRNPNLLWWHDHLWLIDHGAALYRHHAATLTAADAHRPFPQIVDHVLLAQLGDTPAERHATLTAAHERHAPTITPALLQQLLDTVPADWIGDHDYAAYLLERVSAVGQWLAATDGLDATGSASTGPGTGGNPRGPEARRGLGPRVGAPRRQPEGGDAR